MLINTGISINGANITDLVALQGVQWSRADKEGPNAGISLSGLTIRDRVTTKVQLDITCRALSGTELHVLLGLLQPEFVSVSYVDPLQGSVEKIMYVNANVAQLLHAKPTSTTEYWQGVTFSLMER